jgi:hypothetical protein
VLVVGFVGLAELLLTPSLEEVVEQQVEAAGLGQQDVTVDLSGFPVVARVAASGEVERGGRDARRGQRRGHRLLDRPGRRAGHGDRPLRRWSTAR